MAEIIMGSSMRRRSAKARPAVSLDETPREDELPASERFADSGPNPEQVFVSTKLREMISENLDELSPLLRTVFVLRDVQGYSTGEAAKKLGVTENTLKASVARTAPACRTAGPAPAAHQGRRNRKRNTKPGDDGRGGLQLLLSL
jgi:RNA polymerase sigma-70 factor, ECF subfamily